MKKLILAVSVFTFAATAFAQSNVVKTCSTTLNFGEVSQQMELRFVKNGSKYTAESIKNLNGVEVKESQAAKVSQNAVRANLSADMMEGDAFDHLNNAEKLIVHAMVMASEPELAQDSGLDLSAVRSAKVFTVVEDESVNIGSVEVIEAYDQAGKIMGSFVGGFLIGACK